MRRMNSITTLTMLGILVLVACAPSASATTEWTMDLSAEMEDTALDLTYGVNSSATDGYDDGLDTNAPLADPSGFDAYFNEPGASTGKLNANTKALGATKDWTLIVIAPATKTVDVSWTSGDILSNVDMQMQELDINTGEPTGTAIDMKNQSTLTVTGGAFAATTKAYKITATTNADETSDIVINEIMYAPTAAYGGQYNEWIELYNNDTKDIDITDWVIDGKTISPGTTMQPGDYAIIARNDTKFAESYPDVTCTVLKETIGLPNDGELIYLNDSSSTVIGSVNYTECAAMGMAKTNKTLERNATGGWEESYVEGGTPCADNSVLVGVYSVTISQPANQTTTEGVNATYVLTVTNTGNTADTYTLSCDNIDSASTVALNKTTMTLDAGASEDVSLDVTNTTAGTFNVNVTAASPNATATTGYIMTTVGIPSTYSVTISQPANQTTTEGVNATYVLTVTNTGNTADTYTLSCDNIDSASTVALNKTTMTLDAGASEDVSLDVTNTTAGTFNVNVTAASPNATATTGYIMTTVGIPSTYSVTISQPANQTTTEGVNATYVLTVTNTGNTADTYTLSCDNIDSASTVALNKTTMTLDAGASEDVSLDVTNTTAGTFNVNVTAASPNATATTGYIMTTVGIPSTYSVTISQPANQTTTEGVNATYVLTVTNTGNTADTYTLSCDNIDSASTVALNKTTMTLDAGASEDVSLDVTNTTAGTFNVNVTAASPNATATTGYIMTTVGTPSTYGVAISQPANQTTTEGVNATYVLTVENTGNTADTYTLSCDNIDSASTVALNKTTMTLDAGVSEDVSLDVTNTTAGTFNVNVTAASPNATATTGYIMTTVEEAAPTVVTINDWTLDATAAPGTSIDATVNLTNTGTETCWFVVSVSGVGVEGYPIVGLGTVQLDADEFISVPVMIVVPGSADTGAYTLIPTVYQLDNYPAGDPEAIGSGKSVTIS